MLKGVGDVSESSMSVCRRRYEHSQRVKRVTAPMNATHPPTIPAMAPAVGNFDECGKVEADSELLVPFTVVDAQCVKELFPSIALVSSACSRAHV